jgi:DNA-binding response OmpR family regulator
MERETVMIQHNSKLPEILVIEDDAEFCDILCKMLSRRGYEVAKAKTGRDGINRFKERPADLVITDIVLPDKDGIHVILDLQKVFPQVKVIAMSAGGHSATGEEYLSDVALYCNVKHTLTKPFHHDQLFTMIREILD